VGHSRPEVVIETGTWHGGLTVFLASLLDAMGTRAEVITIDIDDQHWVKTLASATFDRRVVDPLPFVQGSSIGPALLAQIEGIVRGRPALVILDSNHSKEHVAEELRLYSRFVPRGGYILVNDTTLGGAHLGKDGVRDIGPLYAVRDFAAENRNFQIDRSKPRFSVSCMHSGVLRRIE
jgi:cephalosporin hydroxylase